MMFTAIASSEKVLVVELETSITRTRKFVLVKSPRVQVRPHVSAGEPRTYVVLTVVNGMDWGAVQVSPPP